ncbi:hypothetical protein QO004_001003 [Rhizobium mesoamericanum]|nr:hypothetical protein [Rhizobium mesoamericanum]
MPAFMERKHSGRGYQGPLVPAGFKVGRHAAIRIGLAALRPRGDGWKSSASSWPAAEKKNAALRINVHL